MFNFLSQFQAKVGAQEGQLVEAGANAVDNCGPACGSALMMVLGYSDIEPQDWTNYEYGSAYHGGETLAALNDFIATHYPNPPGMTIRTGVADPAGSVESWASQGKLTIGRFYCDSQANLLTHWSSISHYCITLASSGPQLTLWNPWGNGRFDVLSRNDYNAASLGEFDICERMLNQEEPMDISEKRAFVRLAYQSFLMRKVESAATLDSWAKSIHDNGDNVDAVAAAIEDSAEGSAWYNPAQRIKALEAQVAALKAQPVSAGDPAIAARIQAIEASLIKVKADL